MPPAPLIFDLDGTLADTLGDICASANHLRRAFGLDPAPLAVARAWVGDGAAAMLERALAEVGPFDRERAWATYAAHHLQQCTRLVQPYPGVAARLALWRAEGRPMAVVTNKPRMFTERILAHLGLSALLPIAVCGDTLPVKKPDPEPLREALRRLGAPAGRGMTVGDGLQDLRAGKAAGLRTAAVLFGFRDPAVLRAEGADEYWVAFGVVEGAG